MICPNPKCGKQNPDDNVFCEYCGTRLPTIPESAINDKLSRCNCGSPISEKQHFCPSCGKKVSHKNEADEVLVVFIILSALCPLAGIIFGSVNLTKKKTRSGAVYLTISIVVWLVVVIFALLASILSL